MGWPIRTLGHSDRREKFSRVSIVLIETTQHTINTASPVVVNCIGITFIENLLTHPQPATYQVFKALLAVI